VDPRFRIVAAAAALALGGLTGPAGAVLVFEPLPEAAGRERYRLRRRCCQRSGICRN
jgi:hypothetical protein